MRWSFCPLYLLRRLRREYAERPSGSRAAILSAWRCRTLNLFCGLVFALGVAESLAVALQILSPIDHPIMLVFLAASQIALLVALFAKRLSFRTRVDISIFATVSQGVVLLMGQGYPDSARTRLFLSAFVAAITMGPAAVGVLIVNSVLIVAIVSVLIYLGIVPLGPNISTGVWVVSNIGFIVLVGFVSTAVAAIVEALTRSVSQEDEALDELQAANKALRLEVLERRQAEVQLARRHEMADLIAEISRHLINLSSRPQRVAEGIEWALERLARYTDIDWSCCGLLDKDGVTLSERYQWYSGDCEQMLSSRVCFLSQLTKEARERLARGQVVHLPHMAQAGGSQGAGASAIETLGVRSLLIVPMLQEGRPVGYFSQAALEREHTWAQEDIAMLRTAANTIMSAYDRKARVAALRASEERYRVLVESSTFGIAAVDTAGRITAVNRGILGMMRLSTIEQALGHNVFDVMPLQKLGFAKSLGECLDTGRAHSADYDYPLPDGTHFHFRGHLNPIRGQDGVLAGIHIIIEDIGERRLLESQLSQASKMEALGRLAGGVAHDFNNLLTIINGYAQLALTSDHDLVGSLEEDLRSIEEAGRRAADLTRQLLSFSRMQTLNLCAVDLNQVLDGLSKMLGRLIGEDVDLEIATQVGLPLVEADTGQLEQVILNLVVNARDAMPTGGRIRLATGIMTRQEAQTHTPQHDGTTDYALLTVRDTGQGIPPEIRERIFDPFFTTKAPGRGTGLGLATVYGIVTQFGGRIDVESTVGQGTTFRIALPVCHAEPNDAETAVVCSVTRGSESILLVEDDPGVRNLTRALLQRLGYGTIEATSGEAALEILQAADLTLDLILSDVVMPGISGGEFVACARVLRPEAPILLMSGYPDDVLSDQGVLDASYQFLAKPFTLPQLAQAVRVAMESERAHRST